jgi:nitrogenase subunit NifH
MEKVISISDIVKSQGSHSLKQGEYNDCVVLSLAASLGVSYDEANRLAKTQLNREPRKGVRLGTLVQWFDSNNEIVVNDIVSKSVEKVNTKSAYLYKRSGKVNYCQMNLNTFIKTYPKGCYYMIVSNHALVIKDGNIIDHAHNVVRKNRIVKFAWKIK